MLRTLTAFIFIFLLTPAAFSEITDAAYQKHASELRTKLKGRGFTVIVERPFVVVGDEDAATVRTRTEQVVRWTVERLKKDFFTKDPDKILEIWLLKDSGSYERHAKEFFNDTPGTPYGYYLPSKKALIMNISTGGGTLVHEIVHPYIEANFPDCPAWFNEGLGSLYEQSGTVGGHIHGYTNWRLPGLQRAIRNKSVPGIFTLTSTTRAEFYGDDAGVNYAAARYLCYYLQERKLLVRFYKEFTANAADDPTGYESLKKVLDIDDIGSFQQTWESFVMKLVY